LGRSIARNLAGLIEGDGSFSTGNRLRITFHLKDRYLAEKLKKSIGFGNIQKPYKVAIDLLIASKKGLQRIITLTNGKFIGPFKINQLLKHGYEEKLMVKILPPANNVSFKNAWLAGFFDADGSAQIHVKNSINSRLGKRTELELSFGQKDRLLLDLIACLFENKKVYQDNSKATSLKKAYQGHKLMFSSKIQLPILFNYFEQFHLQGRKYGQVLKVKQCYELMVEKKHLTKEGLAHVLILQKDLREMVLLEEVEIQ
jgi:hypothetical protein